MVREVHAVQGLQLSLTLFKRVKYTLRFCFAACVHDLALSYNASNDEALFYPAYHPTHPLASPPFSNSILLRLGFSPV